MTKQQFHTLALVLASLYATVGHAQSNDYNPAWYLAPAAEIIDHDGSKFGVNQSGTGVALRLGKSLSPMVDVQFGGTYARSRQNDLRYKQSTLGADALFFFSRSAFRPFVVLGVGVAKDELSNSRLNTSRSANSPEANVGIGLQYSITDRASIQVDARRVMSFLKEDAFGKGRANNTYFGVGLNYALSAPEPKMIHVSKVDRVPPRVATPPPAPVVAPAPVPPPPAVVAPAPPPVVVPPPAVVSPPPPPPPVVVQAPPRVIAPAAPQSQIITLSDTELFALNSAVLKAPQPTLDEIAAALKANPQIERIVVTGHTDRLGTVAHNRGLSQRRADAVKAYLVQRGVQAKRISAKGVASTAPVVECTETERQALVACLAPNRRVEVEQFTIEQRLR